MGIQLHSVIQNINYALFIMINDTTSYSQYINCPEKFVKRSFQKAVDIIDDEFGDGYARKNPVLLSHLVTTQARVYVLWFVCVLVWAIEVGRVRLDRIKGLLLVLQGVHGYSVFVVKSRTGRQPFVEKSLYS